MPDLELKPDEFRSSTKREMSPRWYRNWGLLCLLPLAWGFWERNQIEPTALFLFSGMGFFLIGMAFMGWLRAKGY
jgi:hypothetical protein